MDSRLKEHKYAFSRGQLEKSAIAEHTWRHDHHIEWDDAAVIDRPSRNKELLGRKRCTSGRKRCTSGWQHGRIASIEMEEWNYMIFG